MRENADLAGRIDTEIDRAVREVGPVDVLVLSDRYPPDSMGGAEISLHLALREVVERQRFLVVAFTARPELCGLSQVDGVPVLRIPTAAPWPFHRRPVTALSHMKSRGVIRRSAALVSGIPAGLAGAAAWPEVLNRLMGLRLWIEGGEVGYVSDHLSQGALWHSPFLRRLIAEFRPRVVHADNLHAMLAASAFSGEEDLRLIGQVRDNRFFCARPDQDARIDDIPCVNCTIGCVEATGPQGRRLARMMSMTRDFRRAALNRFDHILVASNYLERQIATIAPGIRLTRIPNAIEEAGLIEKWTADVEDLPGTAVAVVGTLKMEKGQFGLLKTLPSVLREIPDIRLHLAGTGPQEAALKALVGNMGLSEHVIFHGQLKRRELYRLLRACRLVAVPALWPEPFGRVPLEAALVGRPVVAFASGGLTESVLHGVTGLLAETGNFNKLVAGITWFARNPLQCSVMAERARSRAMTECEPARISAKIVAIWKDYI